MSDSGREVYGVCPECGEFNCACSNKKEWQQPQYVLSKRAVVELLYFIFANGYISPRDHEYIDFLSFELKVQVDKIFPDWTTANLKDKVVAMRKEIGE